MGKRYKWIQAHRQSLARLYDDVGKNAYKTYLPSDLPGSLITPRQEATVSYVVVMTSGSLDESRDWMVVLPLRVDHSGNQGGFVHDKDPMTFYLSSGAPGVSGSVAFHSNYPGRTESAPVLGTAGVSLAAAAAEIRNQFRATSGSYADADGSLHAALQYGVQMFRAMEGQVGGTGVPSFDDE